ncbi:hypothetical protein [Sphingomonas segetis]|nr:hypothetical protein [Sphingomonas segetis]
MPKSFVPRQEHVGSRFFKGYVLGVILSIPLWAVIIWIAFH